MTTAAEEFGQLVGTLREWTTAHLATDEPQCRLCPLCQAIGALRESRPDLVEHLTMAAASLIAAAQSLLEGVPIATPGRSGSGAHAGVEHIDVA